MKQICCLVLLLVLASCGGTKDHDMALLNQADLQFGTVDVGARTRHTLTFENSGQNAVVLQTYTIADQGEIFTVLDSAANPCQFNKELAPGAICNVDIEFSPLSDIRYVKTLTITFSGTEDRSSEAKVAKSYTLEGRGAINCNLSQEWRDAYQAGVSQAQQKMAEESAAAEAAANSKTYADGYAIGYQSGYQATYQSNYDAAYDTAYESFFNYHYSLNRNDYFTCVEAQNDANHAAEIDAENDAMINGTNEGYEDGYNAFYPVGFTDGYNEALLLCDGSDYSTPNRSRELDAPEYDPSIPAKCEAKGIEQTYDPAHYNKEYQRFLAANVDYQNGKSQGNSDGRTDGRNDGQDDGGTAGAAQGQADGTLAALEDQYQQCYAEEYTAEYNYEYNRLYPYYYDPAYDLGADEGYSIGFDDGFIEGEIDCGYASGEASNELASSEPKKSKLIELLSGREGMVVQSSNGTYINVSKTKLSKAPLALTNVAGSEFAQYLESIERTKEVLSTEVRKSLGARHLRSYLMKK